MKRHSVKHLKATPPLKSKQQDKQWCNSTFSNLFWGDGEWSQSSVRQCDRSITALVLQRHPLINCSYPLDSPCFMFCSECKPFLNKCVLPSTISPAKRRSCTHSHAHLADEKWTVAWKQLRHRILPFIVVPNNRQSIVLQSSTSSCYRWVQPSWNKIIKQN